MLEAGNGQGLIHQVLLLDLVIEVPSVAILDPSLPGQRNGKGSVWSDHFGVPWEVRHELAVDPATPLLQAVQEQDDLLRFRRSIQDPPETERGLQVPAALLQSL